MKHFLVRVSVLNGEHGYTEKFLTTAQDYGHADELAKERLSEGADERDADDKSSTFYYDHGVEARSIDAISEIPEADYLVLSKYI